MAASDLHTSDLLLDRVEEEIARAERGQAPLSCLLVGVRDVEELSRAYGKRVCEQALAYIGLALRREVRRYDRVGATEQNDYLVVLPGADAPRGEAVARRALARLHEVKIEAAGDRRGLALSVGIATWREGLSARELVAQARMTRDRRTPEQSYGTPSDSSSDSSSGSPSAPPPQPTRAIALGDALPT